MTLPCSRESPLPWWPCRHSSRSDWTLALAVLAAAGLVLPDLIAAMPWLAWAAVAVSALAVILNASSRSAGERRIWVPLAVVMLISSLIVALQ